MTVLAPRRFPETITRRRQAPGDYDACGEWRPGATIESDLRASVQPLNLGDDELEGGSQLIDRRKVYVPTAPDIRLVPNRLRWGNDVLQWGDDTLLFGERAEHGGDTGPALLAAFDDREADRVLIDGAEFVVVETRNWPTFTRATLLRET